MCVFPLYLSAMSSFDDIPYPQYIWYIFFVATRLSIARRNLSYLHLCVFERLTRMCAMMDTHPSWILPSECYDASAIQTYCSSGECTNPRFRNLSHLNYTSVQAQHCLICPIHPQYFCNISHLFKEIPWNITVLLKIIRLMMKLIKYNRELNRGLKVLRLMLVSGFFAMGPSLITSATHIFSLFQSNQLLLLLEV